MAAMPPLRTRSAGNWLRNSARPPTSSGRSSCPPTPTGAGVAIQHFFLARLTSLNLAGRYGPEFAQPGRGCYDLDYVSLRDESLNAIDLKPAALKEFVFANCDALLAEAGSAS